MGWLKTAPAAIWAPGEAKIPEKTSFSRKKNGAARSAPPRPAAAPAQKTIKTYKIKCTEVNCDVDEATANKYKVEGYPTIKLVKDQTVYEYDAKPNIDTLGQFLNSVL